MRIGFISDIHGNLPALNTVLDHMDKQGIETKVCLGDIVGYGAFPNECVERVVGACKYIIRGSHDDACVDLNKSIGFNPLAKQAIDWTSKHTSASNKDFLENLEYGYLTDEGFMFVHGSPSYPFAYIFDTPDAAVAFNQEEFNVAFVGHTHVPIVWTHGGTFIKPRFSQGTEASFTTTLDKEKRHIINVGSVGQPRDNDNRACYTVFDTETYEVTYHRVKYSIDRAVGRMQQAGLPNALWQRLLIGR